MTLTSVKRMTLGQIQRSYLTETLPPAQLRKIGIIYSAYRFIISSFLLGSNYVAYKTSDALSIPTLLSSALIFYMLLSVVLLSLLYLVKRYSQRQLAVGLSIDVVLLSLFLYASGLPDLQLTMLYMVVVAASFMLLSAAQALVITLMAIIFIIYQQFFFAITNSFNLANLGDTLLMSASFLAVGFLSWTISQRLVQVEKTATLQAQEVFKLNAINQEVISKMVSGVLVIDDKKLVLVNQAACQLLHIHAPFNDSTRSLDILHHQLVSLHPELCDWYLNQQIATKTTANHSLTSVASPSETLESQATTPRKSVTYPYTFIYELPAFASTSLIDKLRVELTPLKDNSQLIILEDLRREQASAQQLKLASLGQLTASIAHEIRNPLAAISQASQLLIEELAEQTTSNDSQAADPTLSGSTELCQMIFNQTRRVNRIIEDVLKLSRQQKPKRKPIIIADWLKQFLADHFPSAAVQLQIKATPTIFFDDHHLEQILINLINNALRHSNRLQDGINVEVKLYCVDNDAIIDIINEGEGIKSSDIGRLFDPFFTTDPNGTGLGLYLSQAFSEANHARLFYVPNHKKTCFRLIIPHSK